MRAVLVSAALVAIIVAAQPVAAQDRTFGGYDCTEDCSGHKAGYDWAQRKGIADGSDCGGNSNSFVEGCRAYTQNPYRGAYEDDDGNEIQD